jgi:hypothetical protein
LADAVCPHGRRSELGALHFGPPRTRFGQMLARARPALGDFCEQPIHILRRDVGNLRVPHSGSTSLRRSDVRSLKLRGASWTACSLRYRSIRPDIVGALR